MAALNLQLKNAMKRLAKDLHELELHPVDNVSAAPLEDNMLEWHCNFKHDEIIYHLILFLTDKYPYESPSAEFVPLGLSYYGSTKRGKKGTQICLNIFSDFADHHREWKHEKGLGWSPGYTIQTVLMNVVAFLAESQCLDKEYLRKSKIHNLGLSMSFTCEDCGHTHNKPYPPLENKGSQNVKITHNQEVGRPLMVDYITKQSLKVQKPKDINELYGYGLIQSGPQHRPVLTTPCEFLQLGSFNGMKKAVGVVHSVLKEEIKFFLPLYIHQLHGAEIQKTFENTVLNEIAVILPKCNPKKTPIEEMVIKTIPNLMSATVVEFSKGTQHTSDNSLNGYFALHRLFLWALETYPKLEDIVDDRLRDFIVNETSRSKIACPNLGEWLMLLSGSRKYRWEDGADAYLSESWKRRVMWYVKEDSKLGMLDTVMKYRLEKTFERTAVGRKLLAFQVLFLEIAMPKGMSREDIIKRYDDNLGFPTDDMVKQMKDSLETINNMKTFTDLFRVLRLTLPSNEELYDNLLKSVEYAIWTEGYNWCHLHTMGGWVDVFRRYRPDVLEKLSRDEKENGGQNMLMAAGQDNMRRRRRRNNNPNQDRQRRENDVRRQEGANKNGFSMKVFVLSLICLCVLTFAFYRHFGAR